MFTRYDDLFGGPLSPHQLAQRSRRFNSLKVRDYCAFSITASFDNNLATCKRARKKFSNRRMNNYRLRKTLERAAFFRPPPLQFSLLSVFSSKIMPLYNFCLFAFTKWKSHFLFSSLSFYIIFASFPLSQQNSGLLPTDACLRKCTVITIKLIMFKSFR